MKKEISNPMIVGRLTEEVLESVVQDVEAIVVQHSKEFRESKMKQFWLTGEALRKTEQNFNINISELVESCAADNRIKSKQMGKTNLWIALKFYNTFPEFDKVYELGYGENISMNKIKQILIPSAPKPDADIKKIAVRIFNNIGIERTETLIMELQALFEAAKIKADKNKTK